jgi:hypothetical protein
MSITDNFSKFNNFMHLNGFNADTTSDAPSAFILAKKIISFINKMEFYEKYSADADEKYKLSKRIDRMDLKMLQNVYDKIGKLQPLQFSEHIKSLKKQK